MSFQIHPLPAEEFGHLFAMSEKELAENRAIRMTVKEYPGTPCRVTLADAEPGETVILTNYTHLPSNNPYHGSHAIYVREGKETAAPLVGEVPQVMATRMLSLRAMDANQLFTHVEVVEGYELGSALYRLFADPNIAEVHIHYAGAGCFAAKATRA